MVLDFLELAGVGKNNGNTLLHSGFVEVEVDTGDFGVLDALGHGWERGGGKGSKKGEKIIHQKNGLDWEKE